MYSKGYVATNSARWSAQYYLWIHTCCLKTWSMIRSVTTSRYSCPRQKIKCRPHPTPQFDTERGPLWRVQIITLHEMEKVVLEVRTCTYFMNGDNLFDYCPMAECENTRELLLPNTPCQKQQVSGFNIANNRKTRFLLFNSFPLLEKEFVSSGQPSG